MTEADRSAPNKTRAAGGGRCVTCGSLLDRGSCGRCAGEIVRPDLLGPAEKKGPIGELVVGLRLASAGVRMTVGNPGMLLLVIIPILLNLAVFAGIAWWLYTHRATVIPAWATAHMGPVADVAVGVLAIIAAAIIAYVLSAVVNAPFLEWLSEKTETIVFGQGDDRPITAHYVWNVWIVPLLQALGLAVMQGFFGLILLVLSLTGVLAPVVFVGGVWMLAITLCDYVVARKRYPIRARFTLVNRSAPLHPGAALPFSLLPILLPLGVAGATLAYLRDRRLLGGLVDHT